MEFFNYEPITVNKRICINPGAIESLHKTTASFLVQKAQLNSKVKSWSLSPLLSTIWSSFQECLAEKSDGTSIHTWVPPYYYHQADIDKECKLTIIVMVINGKTTVKQSDNPNGRAFV